MDLHTVNRVRRPAHADEIAGWEPGSAWLAGGTWLFSEPQVDVHTLIDLQSLRWPALQPSADGLEIAATCTVAQLDQFAEDAPPGWTAAAWSDSSPGFTVPYALASNGAAGAFFFAHSLRAGHPTNPANKVLWIVRLPRDGHPLTITAHSSSHPS